MLDAPAFREKEYGIWQSWTWRKSADEIDSLALAFSVLVLAKVTISPSSGATARGFIGRWSRRNPSARYRCRSIRSVAEEMAYVIDHCSARFIVAQDQEQVDKIIEVKDKLPGVEQIIFLIHAVCANMTAQSDRL